MLIVADPLRLQNRTMSVVCTSLVYSYEAQNHLHVCAGQKFKIIKMYLKEVSSAHQGCFYLIRNTVKIVKYYCNLKQLFSMWIYSQMWFISVIKAEFSASLLLWVLQMITEKNHVCCLYIMRSRPLVYSYEGYEHDMIWTSVSHDLQKSF